MSAGTGRANGAQGVRPNVRARRSARAGLGALRTLKALRKPVGSLWVDFLRATGVQVGPDCWVAIGSHIERGTVIGRGTRINGPASIRGGGGVTIGNYCAIGRRATILSENHSMHLPNVQVVLGVDLGLPSLLLPEPVSIGPTCWLGDGVTVLAGVKIGAGAVLAAGSVVTRDVEPFTVVGGVPAREIRRRCSPEVARVLLDSAWWDWPDERIARNREFLATDITNVSAQELASTIAD